MRPSLRFFVKNRILIFQLYSNSLICFALAIFNTFDDGVNLAHKLKRFYFELTTIDLTNKKLLPSNN